MIRDLFFSLRDAFSGGAGGSMRGLIVLTVAGLVLGGGHRARDRTAEFWFGEQ